MSYECGKILSLYKELLRPLEYTILDLIYRNWGLAYLNLSWFEEVIFGCTSSWFPASRYLLREGDSLLQGDFLIHAFISERKQCELGKDFSLYV